MSIAAYSAKRPVTVCMVYMGLILMGLIGLDRLPQELFPPITFPEVTVVTNYFNAAPEEIETLVTKPLEEAVSSVSGLKSLSSVSREGKSIIRVGFDWEVDVDFAALAVREKIDLVKDRLPRDAEEPVVVKFDPLSKPVLLLSLTGASSLMELKEIATGTIKDVLEKADGVASATVSGGLDREILVNVDQGRLYASGLSIHALVESLEKTNLSYPAGTIKKGLYEHLIRTMGEFESIEDIGFAVAGTDRSDRIYVPQGGFVERAKFGPRDTLESKRLESEKERPKKRLILFNDVAEITEHVKEAESISRYDGKENVSISIQKQAGANSLKTVAAVKAALKTIDEELRVRNITADIVYDESIFIGEAIHGVSDEAVQGGFLAFIVLLLILRSWKTSVIVTAAIPISIVGIFFMMFLRNISINTMSLGGLALGAGMLVDSSIVVIENIFCHRERGEDRVTAAITGTEEVVWPVFSSTLTNIAVFFPLIMFVPGVPGQIFSDLAWTVIMGNIMSLVISITLIPMLAAHFDVKPAGKTAGVSRSAFHIAPDRINGLIGTVLIGTTVAFVFALLLMSRLDREVLPKVDQGSFLINVELPIGSRLEGTDASVRLVEEGIKGVPEIFHTAVSIGAAKEESSAGVVSVETRGPHQAQIIVTLKDDRKRRSSEVVDELRRKIATLNMGAATVEFVLQENEFQSISGGASHPVQIEVQGYDFDTLKQTVDSTKEAIRGIPGVFNLGDDQAKASPETKIDIDRRKAALFGISALDISVAARTAIDGDVPSKFRKSGQEIDIRVRLNEKDRMNLEQLGQLLIHSEPFEIEVPIQEMATITQGLGPSEIRHRDQQRTILVTADILPGHTKKDVLAEVDRAVKALKPPQGFMVKLAGEAKEVEESFSRVIFALVLAIVLTYMIMAAQFESFLHPFIIMATVPLSVIGASVALWIGQSTLNIISLLGIVMLGGIVVNNGIVLIEYINVERRNGVALVEACLNATRVRARPILMSAATAVIGLLPLALGLGKGAELRAPMAKAVMGGLISATFLTLIVIPVLYIIFERLVGKLLGKPVT